MSSAAVAAPALGQKRSETSGSEARLQGADVEAAPKNTDRSPLDLSAAARRRLDNDLEVVLQDAAGAPLASVCTAFDAGSAKDRLSAPGSAVVLAEMLKEGGYQSRREDFAELVTARGGIHEVTVSHDSVVFCTTVPAKEVSLAIWVAAGRYSSGALTEENLKKAVDRLALRSEALDAQVRTGRAPTRLRRMAFLGSPDYARPVLPNSDELDSLSLATILDLHQENYVSRRSTVAVSGGFDKEAVARALVKYLGDVPKGSYEKLKPAPLVTQNTGRFSMAEDSSAKKPAAWYGWVAPVGADQEAMDVALSALVSNKRLGGVLVGKGRAAKSMELFLDETVAPKSPSFARLEILGTGSRSLGTIEKAFDTQLRKLASQGPDSAEVRNLQAERRELQAQKLETPLDRARALALGVRFGRSPTSVLLPLKENAPYIELSTEQVRLAAAKLLAPHRRSAIEIYPKGWQDPWQQPMRQYHVVSRGQTLGGIARRYGTSVAFIKKINGLKGSPTIYPGDKLRVPRVKGKKPERKLRTHKVRRGDTLGALALKYGVSSSAIAAQNGMGSKKTIRTGETLRIPWGSKKGDSSKKDSAGSSKTQGSKAAPQLSLHIVKAGETLSEIASRKGVSTVALARANGISHKAGVRVGQKLKVPPRGTGKSSPSSKKGTKSSAKPAAIPAKPKTYRVKKGDTLSGIAQRHGVSVAALTVENSISRKSTLRLGQTLKIPAKK